MPREGEIAGVDFAWAKPRAQAIVDSGYKFVVGYISHDPAKDLADLSVYVRAGLQVGLVFESTADRALGGFQAGAQDGAFAEGCANDRGYPNNAVLFFAVDVDASPADYSAIQAYAQAFASRTNRPVGIYGGYYVVEHFVTPGRGPVQYGWQTVAWSDGRLSVKAHLYQRSTEPKTHKWPLIAGIDPASYDENVLCVPLPLMGGGLVLPPPPPTSYTDPITGYSIRHGFFDLWSHNQFLGRPLSGEYAMVLEDGKSYTVQLFERGMTQYDPSRPGSDVQLARIGWMWQQEMLAQGEHPWQP